MALCVHTVVCLGREHAIRLDMASFLCKKMEHGKHDWQIVLLGNWCTGNSCMTCKHCIIVTIRPVSVVGMYIEEPSSKICWTLKLEAVPLGHTLHMRLVKSILWLNCKKMTYMLYGLCIHKDGRHKPSQTSCMFPAEQLHLYFKEKHGDI